MSRLPRVCGQTQTLQLDSASCQGTVQGFIGDNVLLPCVCDTELPWPVSVFWRDKDDSEVLNIVDNEWQVTMDAKFRGRVSSFQELYRKGNFSLSS